MGKKKIGKRAGVYVFVMLVWCFDRWRSLCIDDFSSWPWLVHRFRYVWVEEYFSR